MSYTFAGFFAPPVEGLADAIRAEWPFLVVREFDAGTGDGRTVLGAAVPTESVCVMAEGVRPFNWAEIEWKSMALRRGLRAFSARFPGRAFVYLDVDRTDGETGAQGTLARDGAEVESRQALEPDADARSSALELLREHLGVKLRRGRAFAALKPGAFGPWAPGPEAYHPDPTLGPVPPVT